MQKTMEQTKTPVIGCVINNVSLKKLSQKRYYYQYGGGYYSYYGKNDTGKEKKEKSSLRHRSHKQ